MIFFLYIMQDITQYGAKSCNTRVKSLRLSLNSIFPKACLLVTEAVGSLAKAGCSLQELSKGCLDEPFGYLKILCGLYSHVAWLKTFGQWTQLGAMSCRIRGNSVRTSICPSLHMYIQACSGCSDTGSGCSEAGSGSLEAWSDWPRLPRCWFRLAQASQILTMAI